MVSLYRDPHGKKIFDKTNPTETDVTGANGLTIDSGLSNDNNLSLETKVSELELKISELEAQLSQYQVLCIIIVNIC